MVSEHCAHVFRAGSVFTWNLLTKTQVSRSYTPEPDKHVRLHQEAKDGFTFVRCECRDHFKEEKMCWVKEWMHL